MELVRRESREKELWRSGIGNGGTQPTSRAKYTSELASRRLHIFHVFKQPLGYDEVVIATWHHGHAFN
jgi:hypothetical protein